MKEIIEGDEVEMICHLVKAENLLGRTLVIDLNAAHGNQFRQIDHRSIEYIIYKNTKYVLRKGGSKAAVADGEEESKEGPKWNKADLQKGYWFSSTSYYQAKKQEGDQVMTLCNGHEIAISKDILEHEMYNASVYAKEEKLALTKVVKILKEAQSTVFTINFTCKVDQKSL